MRRQIVTSAMLRTSTLCLIIAFTPATPLQAADTKQETALKKQVNDLQKDLQQATTTINNLKQEIVQGTAKVNQLQADLKKARANDQKDELAQANAKIAQLQADLKKAKADDTSDNKSLMALTVQVNHMKGARYVHTVVYKLKADSSTGELQTMLDDVTNLLSKVKTIRGIWAGKPVGGENQVAFTMLFDDAAGYKIFVADPQTKMFSEKHGKLWESPTKVDFVVPFK